MKHCMLSHHGEYEYGSPKLPSTPEAFLLHCADNLDAKTKMIEEALDADSTQVTGLVTTVCFSAT